MQKRSLALRALKSQSGKRPAVPAVITPDTPHVFDIDEVDVGKYGWDYTLLVERDERKELHDSLLDWYQQYLFNLSLKFPAACYSLIETHKDGTTTVRHENCGWHELFRAMTEVYRIRGVKPMYTLKVFLHDLQGNNIIPPEHQTINMFATWLEVDFPFYKNTL